MIDVSTLTDRRWSELSVRTYFVNDRLGERGSITTLDSTPRHFIIANIDTRGGISVKDPEAYPDDIRENILPVSDALDRKEHLISQDAFNELVTRMRALTVNLGYPAITWAGAITLRQEACMMQAVHLNRHDYTFEQCLAIIHRFAARHTFWELGALIDQNVPPVELLNFETHLPLTFLRDLYPTPVD